MVGEAQSAISDEFLLGDHRIDPAGNEVDGIRIERKAMDVLLALVSAAPGVVSVASILERVWPNVVVLDNVVHQAIGQLRKSLADDANAPRFIQTVPRRGYRLIAEVRRESSVTPLPLTPALGTPSSDSSATPRIVTHDDENSICVLPFLNLSGDPSQECFSDGLSAELINQLAMIKELRVIGHTSSFSFKTKTEHPRRLGAILGVRYLLEGSVRRTGERLRINAQLIECPSGFQLWSERFDRQLVDVLRMQDEIAQAVARAMRVTLRVGDTNRRRGTSNPTAYEQYLRGMDRGLGADRFSAQIARLEEAVQLDPEYSDAWAALAFKRARLRFERPYAERHRIDQAVSAAADRALALDPENYLALEARYLLLPPFGRFIEGEVLLEHIQALADKQGRNFRIPLARHLLWVGRIREAIDVAQRASDRDPLDALVWISRALGLWYAGRYPEARALFEAALQRDPRDHYTASNLLFLYVHLNDWATADSLITTERLAQFPSKEFERWAPRYASIMRDPSPNSRCRPINRIRRRFDTLGVADFFELQWAAKLTGPDEPFAIGLRARFGPAGTGEDFPRFDDHRPNFFFHSMFPELRCDPRFIKLCARVGLVDYWLTTQKWPDCVDEVAPYYDFRAECERVAAGPPLPPANEAGVALAS